MQSKCFYTLSLHMHGSACRKVQDRNWLFNIYASGSSHFQRESTYFCTWIIPTLRCHRVSREWSGAKSSILFIYHILSINANKTYSEHFLHRILIWFLIPIEIHVTLFTRGATPYATIYTYSDFRNNRLKKIFPCEHWTPSPYLNMGR